MLFKSRKPIEFENTLQTNALDKGVASVLYLNDSIHLIFEACKSCYNLQKTMSYEETKQYIGRRIAAGHGSILEHSNLIFSIEGISTEYMADLGKLCSMTGNPTKYLKFLTHNLYDGTGNMNVVVGGTVRGFKHFVQNFDYDQDNIFFNHILGQLYQSTVKEYWLDVPDSMVDKSKFVSNLFEHDEQQFEEAESDFRNALPKISNKDKFRIVNYDQVFIIRNELERLGFWKVEDIEQLCTITICFENMSRTATHQLVRHRNGITQESQRYVDYSQAGFTVPKLDYLGNDTKFDIEILGQKMQMTPKDIADLMMSIYPQLKSQGMRKEDARAYLPSNVQCKKLFMTFTFSSLAMFFLLRCEKHAQAEIRSYAWNIIERLKSEDEKRLEKLEEMNKKLNIELLERDTWNIFTPSAREVYETYKD